MRKSLWLLSVLIVIAIATASGGRRSKDGCGEWQFSDCVPKRGSCGPGKKMGTRTGATCRVKERKFKCTLPCGDSAPEAEAEPGPTSSPARDTGRNEGKASRRGRKGPNTAECRYQRAPWGECDPATGTKSRTLPLKKGATTCEPSKVQTKKCRPGKVPACKYGLPKDSKIPQCLGGMRNVSLVLKKGNISECPPTVVRTRLCGRVRSHGRTSRAAGGCKYQRGVWSDCDQASNTMTRTMTLKQGGPDCAPTKNMTRKCRKPCRYQKGAWTECDSSTSMKQRVDNLSPGSDTVCESTRTLRRKCANGAASKCKYNFGSWSECQNGKRTRTKSLVSGDASCEKVRHVAKPCKNKGQARCSYEAWGQYGPCQNGVKTKTRRVISGGDECQRRAVKTKPCVN